MNLSKFRLNLLKVFVFAIPFSSLQLYGSPYFNIALTLAYLYLLFSCINFKRNFSLKFLKKIGYSIILLWVIIFIMTFNYYESNTEEAFSFLRLTFFYIILFIVISNDVIKNFELRSSLAYSFLCGVATLSFLSFLGFKEINESGRLTIFGMNTNVLGQMAAISFLFCLNFIFYSKQSYFKRVIFFVSAILLTLLVVYSGSRGAILSLFIGTVTMILLSKTQKLKKIGIVIVGGMLITIMGYWVLEQDIVKDRLEEEDQTSGRLALWEAAYNVISDYPILGTGAARYEVEMEKYYGRGRTPHNEFIRILAFSGIIGITCFLFFLYKLLKLSLIDLNQTKDPLRVIIFCLVVFYFFRAGGAIVHLFNWFLLSYLASSVYHNVRNNSARKHLTDRK